MQKRRDPDTDKERKTKEKRSRKWKGEKAKGIMKERRFFNPVPTPIARWNSNAKYATLDCGIVELWNCGIVELWNCGTVELCVIAVANIAVCYELVDCSRRH